MHRKQQRMFYENCSLAEEKIKDLVLENSFLGKPNVFSQSFALRKLKTTYESSSQIGAYGAGKQLLKTTFYIEIQVEVSFNGKKKAQKVKTEVLHKK